MPTHVVTALHLNLRSAPDPQKRNVIAVLPQGSLVDKVSDSGVAGWFEVETVVAGANNFTYGFLGASWWQGASFKQFGSWTSDVG